MSTASISGSLLRVERFIFKKDWTLSRFLIHGTLSGFGVEDEIRQVKIKGETAIPYGVYPLGLRQSPKFSSTFYWNDKLGKLIPRTEYLELRDKSGWREHDMIWIQNVPGFEYILLHWGNTDDDTDGCYIVGTSIGIFNGQEGVTASRQKYKEIYPILYKAIKNGDQTIEYVQAA